MEASSSLVDALRDMRVDGNPLGLRVLLHRYSVANWDGKTDLLVWEEWANSVGALVAYMGDEGFEWVVEMVLSYAARKGRWTPVDEEGVVCIWNFRRWAMLVRTLAEVNSCLVDAVLTAAAGWFDVLEARTVGEGLLGLYPGAIGTYVREITQAFPHHARVGSLELAAACRGALNVANETDIEEVRHRMVSLILHRMGQIDAAASGEGGYGGMMFEMDAEGEDEADKLDNMMLECMDFVDTLGQTNRLEIFREAFFRSWVNHIVVLDSLSSLPGWFAYLFSVDVDLWARCIREGWNRFLDCTLPVPKRLKFLEHIAAITARVSHKEVEKEVILWFLKNVREFLHLCVDQAEVSQEYGSSSRTVQRSMFFSACSAMMLVILYRAPQFIQDEDRLRSLRVARILHSSFDPLANVSKDLAVRFLRVCNRRRILDFRGSLPRGSGVEDAMAFQVILPEPGKLQLSKSGEKLSVALIPEPIESTPSEDVDAFEISSSHSSFFDEDESMASGSFRTS